LDGAVHFVFEKAVVEAVVAGNGHAPAFWLFALVVRHIKTDAHNVWHRHCEALHASQ
jgi:hypothetical protein